MHLSPDIDAATAERLLAGAVAGAATGPGFEPVVTFLADLRAAAALMPPAPVSDTLAAILARGLPGSAPLPYAGPAPAPPARTASTAGVRPPRPFHAAVLPTRPAPAAVVPTRPPAGTGDGMAGGTGGAAGGTGGAAAPRRAAGDGPDPIRPATNHHGPGRPAHAGRRTRARWRKVALSAAGGLTLAAGGMTVAAAADLLPGPVGRAVAGVLESLTPFHIDPPRTGRPSLVTVPVPPATTGPPTAPAGAPGVADPAAGGAGSPQPVPGTTAVDEPPTTTTPPDPASVAPPPTLLPGIPLPPLLWPPTTVPGTTPGGPLPGVPPPLPGPDR